MWGKLKNVISSIGITVGVIVIMLLLPIIGVALSVILIGAITFLTLEDDRKCKASLKNSKAKLYPINPEKSTKD